MCYSCNLCEKNSHFPLPNEDIFKNYQCDYWSEPLPNSCHTNSCNYFSPRCHKSDFFHKCQICEKKFNHPKELKHHIKIDHLANQKSPQKLHKCGFCDEDFKSGEKLTSHIKNVHRNKRKNSRKPTSSHFEKSEKAEKSSKNSVKSIKSSEKSKKNKFRECNQCSETFENSEGLTKHIQDVHSKKRKSSKISSKSSSISSATKSEISINSEILVQKARKNSSVKSTEKTKYECNICGESFDKSDDLKLHTDLRHKDDKSEKS